MPKISGFDMLDILRSTPETKNIKVIMMTALSSDEQRKRGENLGADRYLVKSQVGIEDVINVVHEVLGDKPSPNAAANIDTLSAVSQASVPASAPAPVPAPVVAPVPAPATNPLPPPQVAPQPVAQPATQQYVAPAAAPQYVAPAVGQPQSPAAPAATVAPAGPAAAPVAPAPIVNRGIVINPPSNQNPNEPFSSEMSAKMAEELNRGGTMGNEAQ
jgi:hypothetical protein